jgi:hypothetical protein
LQFIVASQGLGDSRSKFGAPKLARLAVDQLERGIGLERRELYFELGGSPKIIRIEEAKERAFRQANSGIERGALALVGLMDATDATLERRKTSPVRPWSRRRRRSLAGRESLISTLSTASPCKPPSCTR